MKLAALLFVGLFFSAISRDAFGYIVSTTGQMTIISPPASMYEGDLESDATIFGFLERDAFRLNVPLAVNANTPGTHFEPGLAFVPAGTVITSYYFHADKILYSSDAVRYLGSVTFDTVILGIIFEAQQLLEGDLLLGLSGTNYFTGDVGQFELGSDCNSPDFLVDVFDCATISADMRTLVLNVGVSQWVDNIRVIVQSVPEPHALILFVLSTYCVLLFRRRIAG